MAFIAIPSGLWLLKAQRLDRPHSRSATGGIGSEEEPDQNRGAKRQPDRIGRDYRLNARDLELAADDPGNHAGHPAEERHQHGFNQELDQDVAAAGTHRLADADLARAFSDR